MHTHASSLTKESLHSHWPPRNVSRVTTAHSRSLGIEEVRKHFTASLLPLPLIGTGGVKLPQPSVTSLCHQQRFPLHFQV